MQPACDANRLHPAGLISPVPTYLAVGWFHARRCQSPRREGVGHRPQEKGYRPVAWTPNCSPLDPLYPSGAPFLEELFMYPPLDPLYNPCNPRAPAVNVIACCGMDKFVNRHLSQRAKTVTTTINSETYPALHRLLRCYQRLLRLSRYQKLFTICFRLVHAHRGPPAQASPPNARIGASPHLILGSSL
jgi:hypothetical protein